MCGREGLVTDHTMLRSHELWALTQPCVKTEETQRAELCPGSGGGRGGDRAL